MSEKRKDNKGRILRTGESQRKDLLYQYRYKSRDGHRITVYDSDLAGLRNKIKKIQSDIENGFDYSSGNITVTELLKNYLSLKRGVRYNTKKFYEFSIAIVERTEFGNRKISEIKPTDAKKFMIQLQEENRGHGTIENIRTLAKSAFQMACDDSMIQKNPFCFRANDVIVNNTKKREALTLDQQKSWLEFVRKDRTLRNHYDKIFILINTGLRVSEFCGLTRNDIDFENGRIRVDHQLSKKKGGEYYIEKPKTENGIRFIPMIDGVAGAFERCLDIVTDKEREFEIDGYKDFVFFDSCGCPYSRHSVENMVRRTAEKYRNDCNEYCITNITPHVLRHTFCTNMAMAGMNVKSLQYIMGHAKVTTTLDVYAHADYNRVAEEMLSITTPTTTPFTTPFASKAI